MTTCKHAASGCNYPEGECAGNCADTTEKPAALRLADEHDEKWIDDLHKWANESATELRHLHAENEARRKLLEQAVNELTHAQKAIDGTGRIFNSHSTIAAITNHLCKQEGLKK